MSSPCFMCIRIYESSHENALFLKSDTSEKSTVYFKIHMFDHSRSYSHALWIDKSRFIKNYENVCFPEKQIKTPD